MFHFEDSDMLSQLQAKKSSGEISRVYLDFIPVSDVMLRSFWTILEGFPPFFYNFKCNKCGV